MILFKSLKIVLVTLGSIGALSLNVLAKRGDYKEMDYGPVIGQTIEAHWPAGNVALKGLAIRLGPEAGVVFDTDLLRYAVATEGGWVDLSQTDLTTYKGSELVGTEGREVWATEVRPGWAKDGSFEDPRSEEGNLPDSWGRYGGYYRHGDEIALNYTVGGMEVHETPEAVRIGEDVAFVRNISVGPTEVAQSAYLLEARPETGATLESSTAVRIESGPRILLVRLLDEPAGVALDVEEGSRVVLRLEASSERRLFRVVVIEVPAENFQERAGAAARALLAETAQDPLEFTRGGPEQWAEALETDVTLAVEEGQGYARDSIGIPFENPWGSWMRLAGISFFRGGRAAAISTWNGDIWIVSGFSGEMETVRWERFASGLFAPMGLVVVDGVIHVVERGQVTRLHDLNGDGEADFYENFNNDGVVYPHSHTLCLEVDSEGNFYYFKNGNRAPASAPDHGSLIRLSPDGKVREVFARGIRGANALAVGPGDRIMGADQQGNWSPAERFDQYRKGGFYGFPRHGGQNRELGDFVQPILWMPRVLNNSAGALAYTGDARWGPLANTWILGSYGQGTLMAILVEEVDGKSQGAAVGLPFTLASGPIRAAMNPLDGQLYVLGLRGWGTRVQKDGSLDRIRYTGAPSYLPTALHVKPTGIRIEFSEPLDATAGELGRYEIQRWQYIYSQEYGSPEVSAEDPDKRGRDDVVVKSVALAPDRKSVFLEIPDLRPVMQMRIGYDLEFADGHREKHSIYNTVHRIGNGKKTEAPVPVRPGNRGFDGSFAASDSALADRTEAGRRILETNCRTCHRPPGTVGVGPTLETSKWAGGGKDVLVRILLNGKTSPGGSVMMPFGWMNDADLATLVSYIQTELHDGKPVTAEEVASIREKTEDRETFWTVDELEKLLPEE